MSGNLFIISSPSGGGKGTLIAEVLKNVPNVGYSVSFTTREIRDGEVNGRDYFFVSEGEFKSLIEDEKLLEFAVVHGKYYGTSQVLVSSEIEAGKDVILEIDVQGAEIVRRKLPGCVSVFILPPSFEMLEKRLRERNTESAAALELRLNNARQEVKALNSFDYVIINDEIGIASENLVTVFRGERLRRDRQEASIRDILDSFDENID